MGGMEEQRNGTKEGRIIMVIQWKARRESHTSGVSVDNQNETERGGSASFIPWDSWAKCPWGHTLFSTVLGTCWVAKISKVFFRLLLTRYLEFRDSAWSGVFHFEGAAWRESSLTRMAASCCKDLHKLHTALSGVSETGHHLHRD